tara:strand:- start:391 stop:945 length:555 start_codon:yes stop_codon:yes gene_type:complete
MKRQDISLNIQACSFRKTTLKQIADYWVENNNIDETQLNFDWAEAHTHCWNCGDNKSSKSSNKVRLQRCHIISRSLKEIDTPSNYVLLCDECHSQAPNTSNNNDIWEWIKSNYIPLSLYGVYKIRKALVMFKEKQGYSFFDKAIQIKNINNVLKLEKEKISTHGAKFNVATYYYMLISIVKNYT